VSLSVLQVACCAPQFRRRPARRGRQQSFAQVAQILTGGDAFSMVGSVPFPGFGGGIGNTV